MRVLHALRRRSLGSCWYPQMSRPLAPAGNVRAIFRCSAARTNSNLSEFFFAAREVGVARRRLSLLTAACYRLLLFNFLPCAICCARLRAQAWELSSGCTVTLRKARALPHPLPHPQLGVRALQTCRSRSPITLGRLSRVLPRKLL
jgi:hypothetical protein